MFVGETAVTTEVVWLRGRSRYGTRLPGTAPSGHWDTRTFIAGRRCDALSTPWVVDKVMDRAAFDCGLKTQLTPTLTKGDAVVLDNLAVRESGKVAQILRDYVALGSCSCSPTALQPYSPDLNFLSSSKGEIAFSKLKVDLRAAGAHTFDALRRVLDGICDLASPQEC